MSGSPLSKNLGVEKGYAKKRKMYFLAIPIIGLFIGGGVFAANIAINSGSSIEFGQGTSSLLTCDTEVEITPVSEFDGTTFTLKEVVVSGVNSTPAPTPATANDEGCGDRNLVVKVYDSSSPIASVTALVPTTGVTDEAVTFAPSPTPDATEVVRITIESTN